jgi:putative phosphoesterase
MVTQERLSARRIGLVADTHDEIVGWDDLHPKVEAVLDGVDLVLHCGDVTTPVVLDRLETLAPVRAVRSAADPPAAPPRLADGPVRLDVDGTLVVLSRTRLEGSDAGDAAVVVFGGTHEALVETVDGVLFVNPGSPSLAERTSVAILDLSGSTPEARVVPIE